MIPDMEKVIAVTSTGEDKIIFLDRENYKIIKEIKLTIPNGKCSSNNYYGPHGLAIDTNKKYIYTANSYNGSISIIDMITDKILENICVGTSPCHLGLCKKNNLLYVTNYDSDTISGIDLQKNMVAVQIPINRMPHDMKVSRDGKNLYVSGIGSNDIMVINTENNNVCSKIDLGCSAMHFSISKYNNYLYASCSKFNCDNKGMICILDMKENKLIESYKIGMYLSDIALREKEKEMFVIDAETNYIYKIDMNNGKLLGKAETGVFPCCIGIDETKNVAIISTHIDNTIEIFDLEDLQLISRLKIGKDLNYISTLLK